MTLNYDEINRMIERMDKEARAIREEALRQAWFMRGGLSYEDAMMLSHQERELVSTIVKKNIEKTNESGLPFF